MTKRLAMILALYASLGSLSAAEAAGSVPIRHPGTGAAAARQAERRQSFNDLVRNLVAAREVQPLRAVLDAARKASPGEVVGIKLRRQKTGWVYHVRVLKADGRRAEIDIDGKTLKLLERK